MNIFSDTEITGFVDNGYVKLPEVIPAAICEEVSDILWHDTGVDRNNRSTWTRPVIRLGGYSQEPFRQAANMPQLLLAFDQLLGKNSWEPRGGLGSFPIRFPSDEDPGDTGWHVDASFPGDDPADIFSWRINVHSKGRALLMLFLFSDTGYLDAPTRILAGSHKHVAKILAPYGDEGLTFAELAAKLDELPGLPETSATGNAGTVYLCHPFLVHAARKHIGTYPKFMAQPPLVLKEPFLLEDQPQNCSPVERAIVQALLN